MKRKRGNITRNGRGLSLTSFSFQREDSLERGWRITVDELIMALTKPEN